MGIKLQICDFHRNIFQNQSFFANFPCVCLLTVNLFPQLKAFLPNSALSSCPQFKCRNPIGSDMAGTEVSTIGHFEVQETLYSQGFYRVKRARNTLTGQPCALKLLKKSHKLSDGLLRSLSPLLEKEYEVRHSLHHPNILPAHSLDLNAMYSKPQASQVPVMYMETDLCPYTDFFALQAAAGGPFCEQLARRFFQQLIDAVSYCHKQKVIHWNLRPESLALDSNFDLKVTDFGTEPRTNDASSPPEVLAGEVRSGQAVDVFCCGFILFFWSYFEPPFQRADPSNSFFRQLANGAEKFWVRAKRTSSISADLKSLLAGMMAVDPTQRLSLSEVKAHPWYTAAALDRESAQQQLSQMIERCSAAKSRLCGKPATMAVHNVSSFYRAGTDGSSSLSDFTASFSSTQSLAGPVPLYRSGVWKYSELFLCLSPETALSYVEMALNQQYAEIEERTKSFKLRAKLVTDTGHIKFSVQVLDCSEGKFCLDFQQQYGSEFEFYQLFTEMTRYLETRVELAD